MTPARLLPIVFGLCLACLPPAAAAERVALVIGNGDYTHAKKLVNPVNDAAAVAAELRRGGWQVAEVRDAGVKEMLRSLRQFCEAGRGAEAAVFFYAGHGLEVKGKNYLLPVDAVLTEADGEDALALETLSLDKVLADLGAAEIRLKALVLDSCRDNPLQRSWLAARSSGSGMAAVAEKQLPEGTMLVFSTAPGMVAADGTGRNSPFTAALVERLRAGGGGMADVFGDVASALGRQQPAWIRFDGSGVSFTAFRQYPLVPGDAPGGGGIVNTPPVINRPPPLPVPQDDDYSLLAGKSAGERRMVEVAPGVSIPFRWCPAGSFTMGSPDSEQAALRAAGVEEQFYSSEVQHRVTLSKGFWLAETEVTQGQWQAVMRTTLVEQANKALDDDTVYASLGGKTLRSHYGRQKGEGARLIGVESEKIAMYHVNWEEADEWCEKASRHAGVRGWRMTLPTEAQWEYACRAGTAGMTYAGDFSIKGKSNAPCLDGIAWYGGNSNVGYSGTGWDTASWPEKQYPGGTAGPRRVGTKSANEWGLYDMLGNVWEWCADWAAGYPREAVTDPQGPASGAYRVMRGGSWFHYAARCRAACRFNNDPGYRRHNLGFRPALVPSR